jgi:hypothetical protein
MQATEKTYEMMWDCEYCGMKKLLGLSQRFCAQCGAPQNPAKRYFPPDHEKVAVQDHKFVGADLTCPACKHPMSRACNACTNCGSPLDAGKQVAMQHMQQQMQGGQWQAMPGQPGQPGGYPGVVGPGQPPQPPKKSHKLYIILGCVALALVGTCVVMYNIKRDATMTAARHEWTREIQVQRYEEVEKKGPCSGVPSGAKVTGRHKPAKTCTKKKIDNGDGTFKEREECTQPVEQCDYRVNEWNLQRTAKATGGPDKEPQWPDTNVRGCSFERLGCEREGTRSERYVVYFNEDGEKKKESLSCDYKDTGAWKGVPDGAKYKGKVRMLGGLDCDSLQKL